MRSMTKKSLELTKQRRLQYWKVILQQKIFYDMNSVDRANHLRKNYALGQSLRQRKWWWSILLLAVDVAIVNSDLLYKTYLEMHGFEQKSHYTYQEEDFKD